MKISEILLTERLRISAILESPEGLRAPKLARELALRSPLPPEQVLGILAAAPSESPFLDAMANESVGLTSGHTNPATSGRFGNPDASKEARLVEIAAAAASYNAARGYSPKG